MKNLKTHLFSYNYEGSQYSFEIPAYSAHEAKKRLSRIMRADYDGELVAKIPALPSSGIFVRLYTFFKNKF